MNNSYTVKQLEQFHARSFRNGAAVRASSFVGCFFCENIYRASLIWEFLPNAQHTAICRYCGIDSVLPGNKVLLNSILLREMRIYWFNFVGRDGNRDLHA